MVKKKSRWEIESERLLDALGGPRVNPVSTALTAEEKEKERRLIYLQRTSGGRPKSSESPEDALVTYNFRIRQSQLDRLRTLCINTTKTARELLAESLQLLFDKYEQQENS